MKPFETMENETDYPMVIQLPEDAMTHLQLVSKASQRPIEALVREYVLDRIWGGVKPEIKTP